MMILLWLPAARDGGNSGNRNVAIIIVSKSNPFLLGLVMICIQQ